MSPRLVNVRLDDDRARKAKELQEQGITLSDVVREAIDQRYAATVQVAEVPDPATVLRDLFAEFPDPPDLPAIDYDVHDRKAAREAIIRKLNQRRG